MFTLDDSFLDMVGLSDMPAEQKNNFLAYAQDQLEVRVGEKMSNDLSDAQLEEFERIIDNDKDMINAVIGDNYKEDQLYQALLLNREGEEVSDELLVATLSKNYAMKYLRKKTQSWQILKNLAI